MSLLTLINESGGWIHIFRVIKYIDEVLSDPALSTDARGRLLLIQIDIECLIQLLESHRVQFTPRDDTPRQDLADGNTADQPSIINEIESIKSMIV